jgi:hypothetical protein
MTEKKDSNSDNYAFHTYFPIIELRISFFKILQGIILDSSLPIINDS